MANLSIALGYFSKSSPGRECRLHPQTQLGPAIFKRLLKRKGVSHLRCDAEWGFHLIFAPAASNLQRQFDAALAAVSHPLFSGLSAGNFHQFFGHAESDV